MFDSAGKIESLIDAAKPISLRDIAQRTGVSVSTVSLALRDDYRISAETRQRIQSIAREMGYQPNIVMSMAGAGHFRTQKQQRTFSLAYVCGTEDSGHGWSKGFFDILQPIASRLGYELQFYFYDRGKARQMGSQLYNRGFVGLIVGPNVEAEFLQTIPVDKFCVLCCGPVDDALARQFDTIKPNRFRECRNGLWQLADHGCRRILAVFPRYCWSAEENEWKEAACLIVSKSHPAQPTVFLHLLESEQPYQEAHLRQKLPQLIDEARADGLLCHPRVYAELRRIKLPPVQKLAACGEIDQLPENSRQLLGEQILQGMDRLFRAGIRGASRSPRVVFVDMPQISEAPSV